jgi:hypothetical protein
VLLVVGAELLVCQECRRLDFAVAVPTRDVVPCGFNGIEGPMDAFALVDSVCWVGRLFERLFAATARVPLLACFALQHSPSP